ncbi:hypothetical protein BV25DRAFT_1821994, partial [Artomyces pyxidatus]
MSTDLLRRITPLKAAFAFGAALLVGLTAELVVRVVRDAAATPSATDPARSELAVCRALVGWRVLWDVAWSANMVLIALSGMAPACVPYIPLAPLFRIPSSGGSHRCSLSSHRCSLSSQRCFLFSQRCSLSSQLYALSLPSCNLTPAPQLRAARGLRPPARLRRARHRRVGARRARPARCDGRAVPAHVGWRARRSALVWPPVVRRDHARSTVL